jgi:uncharacterized protein with NRDE domain
VCTLVLAWQVFEDAPIAVAANRDEFLDRPSEPPGVLDEESRVVAPSDGEAGGTWIGYNEHGLFAAITNRWVDIEGDRSRGLLVREALAHESADAAARFVEDAVETDEYAGFNLVVADEHAAIFFEWHDQLLVRNFAQGVHVVVNVGADGNFFVPEGREEEGEEQALNALRVSAALQPEPDETAEEWVERAADVVRDHDYGVCVHREDVDFGTRSSSLLVLGEDGTADYRFADGPPCETEYEQVDVA